MREQGDYSHMTTLLTLANAEELDLTWTVPYLYIPLVSRVALAFISVW